MMTDEPAPTAASLPPGESDPNIIYVAVGKGIHRWESLEQALARLALRFAGIPDDLSNFPQFGKENGTFRQRVGALKAAAHEYFFTIHPDQELEAEFASLLQEVQELSIDRHRIAHGHITMWGEFLLPTEKGPFVSTATVLYRWAPPPS